MRTFLPAISVVASLLGLVTAFLSNIQVVADKVGATSQIVWFAVVGVVLSIALWKLLTKPRDRIVQGDRGGPAHSLGLCILAATSATFVLVALGWVMFKFIDRSVPYPPILTQVAISESIANQDEANAKSLQELYKLYNKSLFEQIDDRPGVSDPSVAAEITVVTGPAGSGKSFLRRLLQEKHSSAHVVRLCDKQSEATHLCQDCEGITYGVEAELVYGRKSDDKFNEMSTIQAFDKTKFFAQWPKQGLILVDDLDELHPKSAARILSEIRTHLESPSISCHVVVFGRPESFHDAYSTPKKAHRIQLGIPYSIRAPIYNSAHSIRLMVNDWASHADPKREPQKAEVVFERLSGASKQQPWMARSLRNLEVANFICERFEEKGDWSEVELKREIIERLFSRATKTHGRPEFGKTDYRRLFGQIAAKHSEDAVYSSGDDLGYFSVYNATVKVGDEAKPSGEVEEWRALNLSGFATMDPLYWSSRRYRFEPLWAHAIFIDEHNESIRVVPPWVLILGWICVAALPLIVFCFGYLKRPVADG